MEDYKIVRYNPNLFEETFELLTSWWNQRYEDREDYLKWKYENNPYADGPTGIVALQNNKVIGFRGYFATVWQVGEREFPALVAGDTFVDIGHRRRGLSIMMGEKACEEFDPYYKFIINLEATLAAVPGYLKLGFEPILDKRLLICSPLRKHGGIKNVEVSDKPKPQEMFNAVKRMHKITVKQDLEFFQYRFTSTIPHRYVFYFCKNDYMVVGCLPMSGDVGYIVDYTENDLESFETLLKKAMSADFKMMYMRNISLSSGVINILNKYRFRDNNLKNKNLCPILVRPVKKEIVEDDWFLNGLDMRDIANWKIKHIFSEWA